MVSGRVTGKLAARDIENGIDDGYSATLQVRIVVCESAVDQREGRILNAHATPSIVATPSLNGHIANFDCQIAGAGEHIEHPLVKLPRSRDRRDPIIFAIYGHADPDI